MDFDRLRYFSVVAETGNIRKAAELLHLSAAAVSKAVKQLESELGVQLVGPAGRGIVITEAGRELAAKGRVLLHEAAALKATLKKQPQAEALLTLGSFEVFTTYLMGPLAAEALAGYSLTLLELTPGRMERALLARDIDLGITYLPIPTRGLEHQKVASITMGIYGRREFKDTPFAALPFAVPLGPVEGVPTRVRGLDGWPEDELERSIRYRVALMESAMALCRQGLAVAYLPTPVVVQHNLQIRAPYRLHQLPGPERLKLSKQSVYLIRRRADPENEVTRKVARALRQLCHAWRATPSP